MGSLTPGATYIYERVGGTVYAREFGKTERKEIGYTYTANGQPLNDDYFKNFSEKYQLEFEWAPILREARNNPTLQEAIERVKILYHLSKQDDVK